MSNKFKVKTIDPTRIITGGESDATQDNKVTLAVSGSVKVAEVTVTVPVGQQGLTRTLEDARGIEVTNETLADPEDEWTSFETESSRIWSCEYYTALDATDDAPLEIRLASIVSRTDPGDVVLCVKMEGEDGNSETYPIRVTKEASAQKFEIIFFDVRPRFLFDDSTRITVQWTVGELVTRVAVLNTHGEIVPVFDSDGERLQEISNPGEYGEGEDQNPFPTLPFTVPESERYSLRAWDKDNNDITHPPIEVRKLRRGWTYRDFSHDVGEPATLFSFGGRQLLAIFRRFSDDPKHDGLYRSENGMNRWIRTSGVPEGMETSPGVILDVEKKLYLLGGSAVDPDVTSNRVMTYNCSNLRSPGSWESEGPAGWSPRMGHACIVFQRQIWVLGGFDENGNPLDDVWRLKGTNWECVEEHAPWAARCMFAATVHEDELWIFGGVEEPFGGGFNDVWKRVCDSPPGDKATWHQQTSIEPPGLYPLGCALAEVDTQGRRRLHLLSRYLESGKVKLYFGNVTVQGDLHALKEPEQLELFESEPHSLSLVEHAGRLYGRALGDRDDIVTSLHIYRPRS